MPGSFWLSASPTGEGASISSSRSASNSLERRPDTFFVWVGHHDAGAFSEARARIDRGGPDSRFFFPGLVENPDAFFAGADAYLMTSREDPFPLVVLDALDARVPVIGFDGGGGFVELLQRDCGVLVPYLDTMAMAEALFRLLEDPTEGHRLSEAGKAIISREYSFIDYARDLVQLAQGPRVSVIVPNFNYAHYLQGSPAFDRDPDLPAARDHLSRRLFD